jgi:hypothetical protein
MGFLMTHIKFKQDTVFLLHIWEIPYNTGHLATLVVYPFSCKKIDVTELEGKEALIEIYSEVV